MLLLTIGMLCLGVLLQMLGVSVTFWDLNGSEDLFSTSVLTGFAVIPDDTGLSPMLCTMFNALPPPSRYHTLIPRGLFHPPNFIV